MRHIGHLPDDVQSQRFSDYLLALGIRSSVEEDDDGWAVWILDEDDVDRAREQLAEFSASPDESHFVDAADAAATIREEEEKQRRRAQKNIVNVRRRWQSPSGARVVTAGLVALSVLVFFASVTGRKAAVWPYLTIVPTEVLHDGAMRWKPQRGLADVYGGQVWRVVTPIFLHFSVFHILFNMLWLFRLGSAIEFRVGSFRYLLLVLGIAAISNLAQYGVNTMYGGGPNFGGMSGVVFGLFGFIWMKSRFDPRAGYFMDQTTVILMIVWLILCMTGLVGNIANTAHFMGLVSGAVFALIPLAWRHLTGQ